MNDQAKKLGELCKQVSLKLTQQNRISDVELYGDVLAEDCLIIEAPEAFQIGIEASLHVNFLDQSFSVTGLIQRCEPRQQSFNIHFKLCHQDSLQTRMLLQLSEIELYRHQMASQGRELSIDQAACEWVDKYAEGFARNFDG